MKLGDIQAPKGANKDRKRVGRGHGSGQRAAACHQPRGIGSEQHTGRLRDPDEVLAPGTEKARSDRQRSTSCGPVRWDR